MCTLGGSWNLVIDFVLAPLPYSMNSGAVTRAIPQKWKEQDEYAQPRALWEGMSADHKDETVKNIAGHLGGAKEFIQKRQIGVFGRVSPDLGKRVEETIAHKKATPKPFIKTA